MPLWHGYCLVVQVPAQLSSLLPLVPLLGMDALVARLLLSGASPCSVELALATWFHFNKYITCIPLYHRVKVPQFSDISNNDKS